MFSKACEYAVKPVLYIAAQSVQGIKEIRPPKAFTVSFQEITIGIGKESNWRL